MQTTFRFDIFSSGIQVILSFVAPWPLDTDVFVFFGKLLTENACLNRIGVLNNPSPANTLHIPTLPSYNCQLVFSITHLQQILCIFQHCLLTIASCLVRFFTVKTCNNLSLGHTKMNTFLWSGAEEPGNWILFSFWKIFVCLVGCDSVLGTSHP